MKKLAIVMTILLVSCGDDADNNATNNTGGNNTGGNNTSGNNTGGNNTGGNNTGGNNTGGNNGVRESRSGPASLSGFDWTSETIEVNGVNLQLQFEFSEDDVTARTICNGSETVETSSPASYSYQVTIPTAGSNETEEGTNTCFVDVAAGTFDFEIVDNILVAMAMGQTVEFEAGSGSSGIFGTWTASADGFTLTWQMGQGELTATADCSNGLSSAVTVDASYRNFVTIEEASSNATDTCNVSIAAGNIEYWFEGNTLVTVFNGDEIRFAR